MKEIKIEVEEESEDAYKQYQERSMYFTAPSKTILAQKIDTTSVKCLKCGTIMMQQQYFGGGIYWLCGKCGSKTELTRL